MVKTEAAAGVGTAALPEGARVDFARMRGERRRRLFEAMAVFNLDALVLGRPANIAYASGARQLWTAGTRPFGPGAVVLRDTEAVHVLSSWDEGVPGEIGHERLFGLSWNPVRILANLKAIPGLAGSRRIGTDGWGPGTAGLLGGAAPDAELVDGNPVLMQARAVKTPDEVECIRTAAAGAEAALSALVGALSPGVTERQLLAVHAETVSRLGLPTPPTEAVVCTTPRRGAVHRRHLASDRAVAVGELVALSPGALYAGYEATLARTWTVGTPTPAQRSLAGRARQGRDALVAACMAGADGSDLGRALSPVAPAADERLAGGVGLGMEPPLIGAGLGAGAELVPGMVLVVQCWVADEGAGGALEADVVLVRESGPEIISRFGGCPGLMGREG
ncbi:MAG: M24 family metallopeptidase [Acidimicrobiales bacterium]